MINQNSEHVFIDSGFFFKILINCHRLDLMCCFSMQEDHYYISHNCLIIISFKWLHLFFLHSLPNPDTLEATLNQCMVDKSAWVVFTQRLIINEDQTTWIQDNPANFAIQFRSAFLPSRAHSSYLIWIIIICSLCQRASFTLQHHLNKIKRDSFPAARCLVKMLKVCRCQGCNYI